MSKDDGSVTGFVAEMRDGGDRNEAAQQLWDRYFPRLVQLARARLRDLPRGAADEEDVALSAFESFCQGAGAGKYPKLDNRGDLWRLLFTITVGKAADQRERAGRKKRGGGRVVDEAALLGAETNPGLDQFAGREPTPDLAAEAAEECRRLLDGLRDENLRLIAILKLEDHSTGEIAARLKCTERTVQRKLDLIRKAWQRDSG